MPLDPAIRASTGVIQQSEALTAVRTLVKAKDFDLLGFI
jgi:hypothetical protein